MQIWDILIIAGWIGFFIGTCMLIAAYYGLRKTQSLTRNKKIQFLSVFSIIGITAILLIFGEVLPRINNRELTTPCEIMKLDLEIVRIVPVDAPIWREDGTRSSLPKGTLAYYEGEVARLQNMPDVPDKLIKIRLYSEPRKVYIIRAFDCKEVTEPFVFVEKKINKK